MKPLEEEFRSFVEVITGLQKISDTDRDINALPIRYGGLGIPNPSQQCRQQFRDSDFLTEELQEAIISGEAFQSDPDRELKISKHTAISHKMTYEKLQGKADEKMRRHSELLQAKGTSTWLTSLPSKQQGMHFNRVQKCNTFEIWGIEDLPRLCECGKENSNDHAMTCQLGGFVILRYNAIRDIEAELLSNVCKDV